MKRWVVLFVLLLAGCGAVPEEEVEPIEPEEQAEINEVIEEPVVEVVEPTVEELLVKEIEELPLDEKIGQLIVAGMPGDVVTDEVKMLIEKYYIGGFILFRHNLPSAASSVELINGLKLANTDNRYPLLMSVDQEGGRVTRLPEIRTLPSNLEIARASSVDLAEGYGSLLARQVRSFGFNMNFAPVLDVNNEPNNPVIGDRAFGGSVDVVIDNGLPMIAGMKGEGVIPVVKHFPGHGDVTVDSHVSLPIVDKTIDELMALELAPFRAAIDAGVDVVMVSHLLLPQIDDVYPASMSYAVLTDLLRNRLAFDGVIITDDMRMGAITNDYALEDAAVQMINAGVDILLLADQPSGVIAVIDNLKAAVADGRIAEGRIDESVFRIIQMKRAYDLVDETVGDISVEQLNGEIAEWMEWLE